MLVAFLVRDQIFHVSSILVRNKFFVLPTFLVLNQIFHVSSIFSV